MKNRISFVLNMFSLVMLTLIWKIVLWDLVPRTKNTIETVVVLAGALLITIPVVLNMWNNALQERIQHHIGRMFHYKKGGNIEQFDAHRNDLVPLMWWRKVTTVVTVVVILCMISYRYLAVL